VIVKIADCSMKDIRTILIILLAVILMATWGFYIYDKSQSAEQVKQTIVADSTEFKKAVVRAVEDSLKRVYASVKRDTVFISKDSLQELSENDSTAGNLSVAPVKSEKAEKPKVSRAAFYFTATGINLTAITAKDGNKPEVTSLANESEKFILSFLLQNRILPTSTYTIYVVITRPDGQVIRTVTTGKDFFLAGKEGWKAYTQKIHFTYTRKSRKTITAILQPASFRPGIYTVKIYHDGKMIGMSTKQLQ
jgi:hypothetical protein